MSKVHDGIETEAVYDDSNMVWVSMCCDSMGYATSACSADIREISRVESAPVYPEDRSGYSCSKHVIVDYCSGGGVATEYCKKFSEVDSSVSISSVGLLKVTQSDLNYILSPGGYMNSQMRQNNYIYLIGSGGGDATFNGIGGGLSQWKSAPYVICPVHTPKAWEDYEKQKAEEEANKPTEPAPGPTVAPAT